MSLDKLLFKTEGRINRSQWWLGQLLTVLFAVVLSYICHFSIPLELTLKIFSIHNLTIGAIIGIAVFWMHLSLNIKRWRDIGKHPGWTCLGYIPLIGQLLTIIVCGFFPSE